MAPKRALSQGQRTAVVALFDAGRGPDAVAARLKVSRSAVIRLYDRWRIHGDEALTPKHTRNTYPYEAKRDIVVRFLAGETKVELAREFDLSSPKLVEQWARIYRLEGLDGLRPKPRGRVKTLDKKKAKKGSKRTNK